MKIHLIKVLQTFSLIQITESMLERPTHAHLGDFALPCFPFAKTLRKSPVLIANDIAGSIQDPLIEKAESVNGYVNIFLNRTQLTDSLLHSILEQSSAYGSSNIGSDSVVTIDMSAPNIAKPFSMGHLRSTVIGNSIALLLRKNGSIPIKINYIGDWGTQFGKLLTAYRKWGTEEAVKAAPIKTLLELYVRFHNEAMTEESLNDEGRAAFKALEDGYPDSLALWDWFRSESLSEFQRIYELLGVSFDSYHGEAFYNDKMDPVVEELSQKGLLIESDGALVVKLGEEMPPCLIKKSDGATLYATRDLAAALDRKKTYDFKKSIYVVGNEQSLHFEQFKMVLSKMGYEWANEIQHVPFGFILKDGKKMSTRKGKVVLLEEVLNEAISLAELNIENKNPQLKNKKEVAQDIGVGAIIFSDLKQHRKHDIEFDLTKMLQVEGETGPYLQYTFARANSLIRKTNKSSSFKVKEVNDYEWEIIKALEQFPINVQRAVNEMDPSIIAKFAINLAQAFNSFYGNVQVISEEEHQAYRIALITSVAIVLKESLRLLGMKAPVEM